mgnify:CR=1 FL=1
MNDSLLGKRSLSERPTAPTISMAPQPAQHLMRTVPSPVSEIDREGDLSSCAGQIAIQRSGLVLLRPVSRLNSSEIGLLVSMRSLLHLSVKSCVFERSKQPGRAVCNSVLSSEEEAFRLMDVTLIVFNRRSGV